MDVCSTGEGTSMWSESVEAELSDVESTQGFCRQRRCFRLALAGLVVTREQAIRSLSSNSHSKVPGDHGSSRLEKKDKSDIATLDNSLQQGSDWEPMRTRAHRSFQPRPSSMNSRHGAGSSPVQASCTSSMSWWASTLPAVSHSVSCTWLGTSRYSTINLTRKMSSSWLCNSRLRLGAAMNLCHASLSSRLAFLSCISLIVFVSGHATAHRAQPLHSAGENKRAAATAPQVVDPFSRIKSRLSRRCARAGTCKLSRVLLV